MSASILFLGLLMGMRHAVESDHVAAVSSIASRNGTGRSGLWLGLFWGLGHAVMLFTVGSVFLLLDISAGIRFGHWMELAVGLMLVWLGGDLIYRMVKHKIHFHAHNHDDGSRHVHAHAHGREVVKHNNSQHKHFHTGSLSVRAFVVGMVHGTAGSAALAILALQAIQSFSEGMVYMAVFGAGSVIGMGILTVLIVLPMKFASKSLTRTFNFVQASIGLWTVVLGSSLVYEQAQQILI